MNGTARHAARMLVLVAILSGLSGCDWWPPALQEKIGEQEAQLKALEAEKANALKKAGESTKAAEEARTQAAQAAQALTALQTENAQLRAALEEAEAKSKKGKPAPAKKK